jgi:hypothetical protein
MQAQTIQSRSFRSLLVALVAASVLLLGGVGGYTIRTLIGTAPTSTTRVIQVDNVPAPGGSAQTAKASRFAPQPQ